MAEEKPTADHEETTIELGDLLAKLNQIDKRLKNSEEDREVIKKEIRYNKHEYLDSYFNLAKATEERLKEMSDKVEATNEEREKNIKTDMQQLKNRYDDVNSQLGSLERRMDTMSKSQAESSCAIQAKLDAILRGSTPQERPAADRTQGTRVDFVEPQRNKRQSTPLPIPRDAMSIAPTAAKNNNEEWNVEHDDWSGRFNSQQQLRTGCYDMGQHLGDDEQDSRGLRHEEH